MAENGTDQPHRQRLLAYRGSNPAISERSVLCVHLIPVAMTGTSAPPCRCVSRRPRQCRVPTTFAPHFEDHWGLAPGPAGRATRAGISLTAAAQRHLEPGGRRHLIVPACRHRARSPCEWAVIVCRFASSAPPATVTRAAARPRPIRRPGGPLSCGNVPAFATRGRSAPNLDARGFVGHPQGMSCRGHMVAPGVRLDERAHLWVGCPLALPHVRLVVSVEPSGLVISLARSMSSR